MTETITSEPAGKRGRNGSVILTDRICEKRARGNAGRTRIPMAC
jgi:hypothetical protein